MKIPKPNWNWLIYFRRTSTGTDADKFKRLQVSIIQVCKNSWECPRGIYDAGYATIANIGNWEQKLFFKWHMT